MEVQVLKMYEDVAKSAIDTYAEAPSNKLKCVEQLNEFQSEIYRDIDLIKQKIKGRIKSEDNPGGLLT